MSDEAGFEVDCQELARLATCILSAADGIGDAQTSAAAALAIPAGAFGNSAAGSASWEKHEALREQLGSTAARLGDVLTDDVDRIYQVAFAYRNGDHGVVLEPCPMTNGPFTTC